MPRIPFAQQKLGPASKQERRAARKSDRNPARDPQQAARMTRMFLAAMQPRPSAGQVSLIWQWVRN